jgi:hypothetical protein
MPSDDDHVHESPLRAADDERIRRLLAEARHTEPLPAAVADRLDEVLGGLVTERRERDATRPAARRREAAVVDLAARRRKTVVNLLVAAAAVVAVGIGITQVLPGGIGDGGGDALTAEDSGGETAPQDEAGSDEEPMNPEAAGAQAVTIRSERFAADVRKARARVIEGVQSFYEDDQAADSPREGCVTVPLGPGMRVPALYDGAPGVLVLRPASGDVQVVDLYLCDDTEPRRSITLTAD